MPGRRDAENSPTEVRSRQRRQDDELRQRWRSAAFAGESEELPDRDEIVSLAAERVFQRWEAGGVLEQRNVEGLPLLRYPEIRLEAAHLTSIAQQATADGPPPYTQYDPLTPPPYTQYGSLLAISQVESGAPHIADPPLQPANANVARFAAMGQNQASPVPDLQPAYTPPQQAASAPLQTRPANAEIASFAATGQERWGRREWLRPPLTAVSATVRNALRRTQNRKLGVPGRG